MRRILFKLKLLIRQLSRLRINRKTGHSVLERDWLQYVLKGWAVRVWCLRSVDLLEQLFKEFEGFL